jgi:hypothetical protein
MVNVRVEVGAALVVTVVTSLLECTHAEHARTGKEHASLSL